jgi:hypothetical protein
MHCQTASCTCTCAFSARTALRLFKITWTLKEGGWPRYIATQLAGMYRQVFGIGKVRRAVKPKLCGTFILKPRSAARMFRGA